MANCENCIKSDTCKYYEPKSTVACERYSEPVRHGDWVYDHWCEFKCSECGEPSNSKPYKGKENFCPNCGAKMDGNEIIKALACCTNDTKCYDCPYDNVGDNPADYMSALNVATFSLINRQKAEIKSTKAKAIREFAKKLKCKLADHNFECNDQTFEEVGNWLIHKVASDIITDLVKGMTEG